MRTTTEQRVIDRFKEIGGTGWMFTSKERTQLETYDIKKYLRETASFYGKREAEKLAKRIERHQVSDGVVWCSNKIYARLMNEGTIEPIEGIPGCFRLKDYNAQERGREKSGE